LTKYITYKLLYRTTRDGNSSESFHQKCDNIKGTLTIIKTTKDLIFGGYTEKTWEKSNGLNKKDENGIGFCFSLNLKKNLTIQMKLKVQLDTIVMKDLIFMEEMLICLVYISLLILILLLIQVIIKVVNLLEILIEIMK